MRRGTRLTLSLTATLVALAFWMGRQSVPPRPLDTATEPPPAVAKAAGLPAPGRLTAQPSAHSGSQAAPPPLPAAGTPLAGIFDELAARARAGDAPAACRLGAELMRCRGQILTGYFSQILQNSAEASKEGASDEIVDVLATMKESAEGTEPRCAGISQQQMNEAIEFQRLAAERGDVRMRLWYATDPALDRAYFLNDLDQWEHYRQVAPIYLQEALAAGDPSVPAQLELMYTPKGPWPSLSNSIPLRQPDEHRYFVYKTLAGMLTVPPATLQPLLPGMVDMTPQPSPDLDMAAVRVEAERLRQKYYANHVPTTATTLTFGIADRNDPQRICGE